jgi:chemotaxis protein CheC
MFHQIDERDLDALKEISNIGAGHAVTALHQMTHRVITLEVPAVNLLPFSQVVDTLGGPEEEVVGLFFRVYGASRGNMLVVMPRGSAERLLTILFNGTGPKRPLGELEISALKEVGNILASSYLSAVGGLLSLPLIPSIPAFSLDMAQAVVDLLLIELAEVTHQALVIQTDFTTRDKSFAGHFCLLPDPASIETILKAIEKINPRG